MNRYEVYLNGKLITTLYAESLCEAQKAALELTKDLKTVVIRKY